MRTMVPNPVPIAWRNQGDRKCPLDFCLWIIQLPHQEVDIQKCPSLGETLSIINLIIQSALNSLGLRFIVMIIII